MWDDAFKPLDKIKLGKRSQEEYQMDQLILKFQQSDSYNKQIFEQCSINLKPLIKQLKKESLNIEILDSLYVLVRY